MTQDEERNLPDLLSSIALLSANLYAVDSGSEDRTVEILKREGCLVYLHPFENYAAQRNWAFENLPIVTPWTLCLDADERLTHDLAVEIRHLVQQNPDDFDGYLIRKRTIFMGKWLRNGGQYPSWHLRLFRTGRARCEDRRYDQHFLVDGRIGRLKSDYIDILTDDLGKWTSRHNRWSSMEADEITDHAKVSEINAAILGNPIERKRYLRNKLYLRFPILLRPFLLFIFDYVVRLGFLDGRPGLIFHVLQRFWFRFLTDAKLYERRVERSGARP